MSDRAENSKPAVMRIAMPSPDSIAEAARMLRAGRLVAFPTETVYGLGADATSDDAVASIFEAKRRPSFNPLIAHVENFAAAEREGAFTPLARRLAEAFWPGPLTLVLPVTPTCRVSLLARAGLDTLALRVPSHPVALQLLAAVGRPVAAPSANPSGRMSPTTAAHVAEGLAGRCDLVLDGGPCDVGLESTIVDCTGPVPRLLRPGGIAREDIESVLGQTLAAAQGGKIAAPGMLESHYAPAAAMRLNSTDIRDGEAALDFGGRLGALAPRAKAYADLSPRGDLREAAARLFAFMRKLDASGARTIAVAPIPFSGLGEAINDRLARAAAPRNEA